jgi:hypothetical protein
MPISFELVVLLPLQQGNRIALTGPRHGTVSGLVMVKRFDLGIIDVKQLDSISGLTHSVNVTVHGSATR